MASHKHYGSDDAENDGKGSKGDIMFPHFLIIGASRAGTTSLHMYMGEHPDTVPPNDKKELQFFNLWFGEDRFPAYSSMWKEHPNGMLRYESSSDYLFYPEVPGRVKLWIPECKFLVLLRDPTDRAWSEYWNFWLGLSYPVSFDEFVRLPKEVKYETPEQPRNPYSKRSKWAIIQKGLYVKQLKI